MYRGHDKPEMFVMNRVLNSLHASLHIHPHHIVTLTSRSTLTYTYSLKPMRALCAGEGGSLS